MNKLLNSLREKAKSDPRTIIFPETEDERVIEAVKYIEKEKIANPILLSKSNIDKDKHEQFSQSFYERKKARGMTIEQAREVINDPLMYSAMLVRADEAEGLVAGAVYTTASMLKAVINCFSIDRAARIVTSCFLMVVPDCSYGEDGVFLYADCGAIPYPTSEQLASIGIASARFFRDSLKITPRVAFLSFSTKGSAKGEWIDKVSKAVELARKKDETILIDGEIQADTAIVPEAAKKKLKNSPVAGKANILIFPNLDAGNICYKLTERLAKARAVGPLVLGTVQPCSDLSRACSVEDIIDCTAITVLRAQSRRP